MKSKSAAAVQPKKPFSWKRFGRKVINQRYLFLLCIPAILIVGIFHYGAIYGIVVAFKDYSPRLGITGSPWLDPWYENIQLFFQNTASWTLLKNTFVLGFVNMLFGFPFPIILALLLNELKNPIFKRTVQTISYIPHFITIVVVVGMINDFAAMDGIFNKITGLFGAEPIVYTNGPDYFLALYVGSSLWQNIGYGSIIYLSALSNVDPTLYDVASIDGANRWQKCWNIAWPTIRPTTTILLIMQAGNVFAADAQKVILMQNDTNRAAVDVIRSYVYREGIQGARFEYTTAVNLFLSVISFIVVFAANQVTRVLDRENSLW